MPKPEETPEVIVPEPVDPEPQPEEPTETEPEISVIPENPEESGTPDFVIIEPPPAA